MFCPKCGNADQTENTYCRRCGAFLPDFDKLKAKEITPEQHLTANTVMSSLTAIVSLTLAVLLYAFFLGRADTSPLIYITAGFLTAMFFWQAQVFWRTLLLKKQIVKRTAETPETASQIQSTTTKKLLNEPDFDDYIPASVVDNTTKHLDQKVPRKSS